MGVGSAARGPSATTLAVFRLADAGPPPWRLRVKVVGVDAVDIVLDPTAAAEPPVAPDTPARREPGAARVSWIGSGSNPRSQRNPQEAACTPSD